MRLLDYMREEGLDDEAFAGRLGECGPYAVKKWKYGEREPDASTIVRIERATSGRVRLADWATQSDERKAKRLAGASVEALA